MLPMVNDNQSILKKYLMSSCPLIAPPTIYCITYPTTHPMLYKLCNELCLIMSLFISVCMLYFMHLSFTLGFLLDPNPTPLTPQEDNRVGASSDEGSILVIKFYLCPFNGQLLL